VRECKGKGEGGEERDTVGRRFGESDDENIGNTVVKKLLRILDLFLKAKEKKGRDAMRR
jgi:hypothetical protein